MSRKIKAGEAYVLLGVNTTALQKGLRAAQQRLQSFGRGLQTMGAGLMAASAAVIGPVIAMTKHFMSAGDQLNKMSARTGAAVEDLSLLSFAAEQSGGSLEAVETGLRGMSRLMLDAKRGTSTAVDTLTELGLTFADLESLTPVERLKLFADRIAGIRDPNMKAALAMKVFGKSGSELIPLLDQGSAGIAELMARAEELGLTVSTETAQDAATLTDTLNELWRVLKNGAFQIGASMAPLLVDLAKRVVGVVIPIVEWIKSNRHLVVNVVKIAAAVGAAGAALAALGTAFVAAGAAIGGVLAVAAAIKAAIVAVVVVFKLLLAAIVPILIIAGIAAAVVAATVAFVRFTAVGQAAFAFIKGKLAEMFAFFSRIFGGVKAALQKGDIVLAAKILWQTVVVIWRMGMKQAVSIWENFKANMLIGFDVFRTRLLQKWGDLAGGILRPLVTAFEFIKAKLDQVLGFLARVAKVALKVIGIARKAANKAMGTLSDQVEKRATAAADVARGLIEEQVKEAMKDEGLSERTKATMEARDRAVAEQERLLEEEQRKLGDLLKEAHEPAAEPETPEVAPPEEPPDFSGVAAAVESASSVGTFSAQAASLLGGNTDQRRIAKASEDAAKILSDIYKLWKTFEGLTFAP
jgi:hypothetical protein